MKTSAVHVDGEKNFGQSSIAESMASPMISRPTNTARVAGTHGPEAKRCVQLKLRTSSALSNTAGTTTENEIVQSRLNWSGLNSSRPRYSQFAVRRLITSNSHHTGAENKKSSTKFFRERDQSEMPPRLHTSASRTKIYPSQSGKKRDRKST